MLLYYHKKNDIGSGVIYFYFYRGLFLLKLRVMIKHFWR
jgi:hypothetical protein